jgi:hypothetical protein
VFFAQRRPAGRRCALLGRTVTIRAVAGKTVRDLGNSFTIRIHWSLSP